MSDDDTSDDDDDVFLDLLERFPSSDEVLAAVRKHRTVRQFQIFAEKGLSALTCDEIGTVDRKDAWRSVLHTRMGKSSLMISLEILVQSRRLNRSISAVLNL